MRKSLVVYLRALGKGWYLMIFGLVSGALGFLQDLVNSQIIDPVFGGQGLPPYVWYGLSLVAIAVAPFVAFHNLRVERDGIATKKTELLTQVGQMVHVTIVDHLREDAANSRTQIAKLERELEEERATRPRIGVELRNYAGLTSDGQLGARTFVLRVRNAGAAGKFFASMDVSGNYLTLQGHHRLCWTRSGSAETDLASNDEDYLHLATSELVGDGGQGTGFSMRLYHFDPLLGHGMKDVFASIGYTPGQGPETSGVATVTISTSPRAQDGEWVGELYFTPRGLRLGKPVDAWTMP